MNDRLRASTTHSLTHTCAPVSLLNLATLPKKLHEAGKIEHNLFSICYRREWGTSKRGVTAGSMTLGGVSNNLDTSPMVYAKNMVKHGWYTVFVKNIFIRPTGGQSAKSVDPLHQTIQVRIDTKEINSGKGVIVDSGTTDTYLSKRAAKEFTKAWKVATGETYTHASMRLSPEKLRSLPTVLIQCQAYSSDQDPSIEAFDGITGYAGRLDPSSPKDLLIAIPATSYMEYSPRSQRYTSRLFLTETDGGVLGANAMQGHNVLFDWHHGRVGFAESSCTYDKTDAPWIQDHGYSRDCEIGDAVLTKSCRQTVKDLRLCKNNPTSIALLGKEVWTALVEHPGSDGGVTCVEVASDTGVPVNGQDEATVQCDGNGVCEEVRPCQLTCRQAAVAAQVHPLDEVPAEGTPKCGVSRWSACDYNCQQTKIRSTLFSDGHCHEVSRETRSCHIGACARSDPCRVPFIVHVVLAFAGGSVQAWSPTSEEILATALSNSVNDLLRFESFSAGDVNVLVPLSWYEDIDESESERNAPLLAEDYAKAFDELNLGMKVVVEISMFNPLADETNITDTKDSDNEEHLLSKVLRNFTDRIHGKPAPLICHQEELYPLAKRALKLKSFLQLNSSFFPGLIEEIRTTGKRMDRSTFGPVDSLAYNSSANRVLSIWTIRTGIEEEVNYFGPQRSFRTIVLGFLQNFAIVGSFVLSVLAVGSYAVDWKSKFNKRRKGYFAVPRFQRRHRVEDPDNPDDVEASVLMGAAARGTSGFSSHSLLRLSKVTKRIRRDATSR